MEVLKAVREGVDKPTRIMYAANMSWEPTKKVLNRLVDRGFVSVITDTVGNGSRRRFEITEKGVSVINYFEGAKELVDIM